MQPSAVALPNSQSVGASGEASRVVPIFNSANSEQAIMTGYLYSSKIVFAVVPVSGSSNFYVGLPKSLASTTGGRVKVAEVFASQGTPAMINNYSFAFNRFAVFVLEKDLIAANPAQLLTEEMDTEKDIPKIATAYSYGEYGNRTSTGSVKPCEGGPCSKDVRSLQLRILALKGKPPVSVMPNFPDQFKGQIILENSVDPKAGIACYGDGGAPVLTSYRNQELYMGAIADQFYVKACGAFPQATYDKDGKLTNFGYDTDLAISFISPVYKHTDLIDKAKKYAKTLATPSPTPATNSATSSPTPSTKNTKTATEIEDCWAPIERRRYFHHVRRVNEVEVIVAATPEETQFRFFRGMLRQNPSEQWMLYWKSMNYKICKPRLKEDPTFSNNVIAYKAGPIHKAAPLTTIKLDVEGQHDVLLLEGSTATGKSLDFRMMGSGQAATASQANWCSTNSALPLAGLFNASDAMAGLLTARLAVLKNGGIPAAVTTFTMGGIALITNIGIDNKWDVEAGYGLVSGPIELVLASDQKIPKTLFVKGIPIKVTRLGKQFKKAGAVGKTFVVASIVLTMKDAADLGEAIGEITYGVKQKEFQEICNRSGW